MILPILFLFFNFLGLALGSFLLLRGPSAWYVTLDKAPWTPPDWMFGAAWTIIMICFSFYLAALWTKVPERRRLIALFTAQWILNVVWNPIFFYFEQPQLGLGIIGLLTLLVGYMLVVYYRLITYRSLLLLPYFLKLLYCSEQLEEAGLAVILAINILLICLFILT